MEYITGIYKLFAFDMNNLLSFNSGAFMLLFAFFIAGYSGISNHRLARSIYVIAFGLFFYYKISGWFLLLFSFTIISDYFIAQRIHISGRKIHKQLWLAISLCINLGLLIYFKYTNFFLSSINAMLGNDFNSLNILIPVGISFYTFRTISYIIDVYREESKPSYDLDDFAFYMTFFPLLLAGPITRAKEFLPQIAKQPFITSGDVSKGLWLIISGLIKKAIIADYVGQYCNMVFDTPGSYSGFENLMAVYGFSLQIYCDFSGYTDMAIGLAILMGFNIGINFNKPYHALNITDFWRRWHISLSSWLRDYIFTPLTLKFRGIGVSGIILALFITFVICGLWHGANLTFILWGAAFGVAMSFEALTAKVRKKIKAKTNTGMYNVISWFITFHLVTFLWIVFRAADLKTAEIMINQVFSTMDLSYLSPFIMARRLYIIMLLLGFAAYAIPLAWYPKISSYFYRLPFWGKSIILFIVIQLVIQFQSAEVLPFLYTQF